MDRRDFLTYSAILGGSALLTSVPGYSNSKIRRKYGDDRSRLRLSQIDADVVIVGGGVGGVATALAACRNGLNVIMTEETKWIGGQLTQQGVPPDEHQWIETHGAPASYRDYRTRVRNFYKRNYPLTAAAKFNDYLNPGNGGVSRLCHEPIVSVAVLYEMLMPFISSGKLTLLLDTKARSAETSADRVIAVTVENLMNGDKTALAGKYFVDATELGDLLPMTKTEYITGTESQADTGEMHAPDKADPTNNQSFTLCFAMDYVPGCDFTIDKPEDYDYWRNYVPEVSPAWASARLLNLDSPIPMKPTEARPSKFDPVNNVDGFNLWQYRKILDPNNFLPGTYKGGATLVNWPQNDYMEGNIVDVSEKEFNRHVAAAKQLNLSLFYWLQTEAPREDGGQGWKGLRLRSDLLGSDDGMALYPYIREARRIKPVFRILEQHVGKDQRKSEFGTDKSEKFFDSVGVGYYHLDLHPTCNGTNYVDVDSLPFQIPLGALLPERVQNLIPVCKNIGTTHITNGCYRLHPVEWSIGEAAGCALSYSLNNAVTPHAIRDKSALLYDFQEFIRSQGLETDWK
ncbi:MAG: FAD-dependent oxidoreductase [Bacteroidales bacterium]|nr:FAD-dependent oxidoreductase [Bacteroidales bacterium]MDY6002361.1 FAD-dependent oxidoreductase [Candidatus Cryptobacteroides sp.]